MRRSGHLAFATLLACTALVGCKSAPSQDHTPAAERAPGAGEATTPGNEAAPAAQPGKTPGLQAIESPFLWSARKDAATIHLLGTMHLGVDAARQFPPWLWSRFEEAGILVVEVDTKDPTMLSAIMRTDGTTLDQELGPETWAKLEAAVGRAMAGGLRRMKASAATAMLAIQGLPSTPAMDMVLASRAADAGKELVYLETASFQLDLLDKYLGAQMLAAILDDLETARQQNQQMLASYLAGDETALEALATDPSHWHAQGYGEAEFRQMLEELLYARNQAWIPRIEEAAGRGRVFVAVGALHLFGQGGVLDLLAGRGYTIERITSAGMTGERATGP